MHRQDQEDFEEFLAKVEDIKSQIEDISNGKIDEKRIQETTNAFNAKKVYKEKLKKIEEEEQQKKLLWGREGKGEKENYDVFCPRCTTEFLLVIPKCTRCGAETIPQKERREQLLKKVEDYK